MSNKIAQRTVCVPKGLINGGGCVIVGLLIAFLLPLLIASHPAPEDELATLCLGALFTVLGISVLGLGWECRAHAKQHAQLMAGVELKQQKDP
jgi:hypothetical protein